MLQFYFLSILLNIGAGLILIYAVDSVPLNKFSDISKDLDETEDYDSQDDKVESKSPVNLSVGFIDDLTFRLVVSVLSVLVGVMKLLSTVQNDVPVIGDLVPSIAGITAGIALFMDYYTKKSDVELSLPSFVSSIFIGGRKYLGMFCIISGILHFVFPRVLFL